MHNSAFGCNAVLINFISIIYLSIYESYLYSSGNKAWRKFEDHFHTFHTYVWLSYIQIINSLYVVNFPYQVSLVEALESERLPSKPRSAPLLPLVRESRAMTGHGILTSRQKRWMQGRPNESSIENPVHFKWAIDIITTVQ